MRLAQTSLLAPRPANDVRTSADARIERALEALRSRTCERWTVAKLAKVAGLSRAAFARRFVRELGAPPLHYLAELRMRRALELLAGTDATLSEIAERVGYSSEFALSRAFRRCVGEPPSVVRRRFAAPASAPRCAA